jgi:hypothetical protein
MHEQQFAYDYDGRLFLTIRMDENLSVGDIVRIKGKHPRSGQICKVSQNRSVGCPPILLSKDGTILCCYGAEIEKLSTEEAILWRIEHG